MSDDYGANASPRIVPLPVINPESFTQGTRTATPQVVVENIFGFFIEGTSTRAATRPTARAKAGKLGRFGRIVTVPGFYAGGNVVDPSSSFIRQIVLIR